MSNIHLLARTLHKRPKSRITSFVARECFSLHLRIYDYNGLT